VAGVSVEEVGEDRPDGQGRPEHVREHHRLPELGLLLEEAALGAEAGVGERGVDAAEAIERLLDEALLVGPLRHVAADDQRAVVAQFLRERAQLVLRARAQHDLPAFGNRGPGGSGADARGRSGYEKYALVGHALCSTWATRAGT
jgi:hypothetical protein